MNGAATNFQLEGSPDRGAPVVVLCHSLGTSSELWAPQISMLSRRFRVLRYDVRGHGGTPPTGAPYTIELLARDLIALLDQLGLNRVHFCGVSLGGFIGQWLGINAPERIERLVLANTAAWLGPADHWNVRIEAVRRHGLASLADASMERWFSPAFRARRPDAVAAARRVLLATSEEGYIGCCAAIRDMDHRSQLAETDRPTLVIAGAMDSVTPPEASHWLARQLRDARVVTLPAAHLANVEAAGPFNEHVESFLSTAEVAHG